MFGIEFQRLRKKYEAKLKKAVYVVVVPALSVFIGYTLNSYLSRPSLAIQSVDVEFERSTKEPIYSRDFLSLIQCTGITHYTTYLSGRGIFSPISLPTKGTVSIRDLDTLNHFLNDYIAYANTRKSIAEKAVQELSVAEKYSDVLSIAMDYTDNVYAKSMLSQYKDVAVLKELVRKSAASEPVDHQDCIDKTLVFLSKSDTSKSNTLAKAIHFRVTILNTGGTDGLILNKGEALLQSGSVPVVIEDEPEFLRNIPVYLDNTGRSKKTSGVVGRVGAHSLTQLWLKTDLPEKEERVKLGKETEKIISALILYNHANKKLQWTHFGVRH